MRCSFSSFCGRNPTLRPSIQLGWSTRGATTLECDVRCPVFAGEIPHCGRKFSLDGPLELTVQNLLVPVEGQHVEEDSHADVLVQHVSRAVAHHHAAGSRMEA